MERYWRDLPLTAVVGGNWKEFVRDCNERADKARVWVEEAQRWLDEA